MLLRQPLHHLVQLGADGGGGGDLYLAAKAAHPAEKLLARIRAERAANPDKIKSSKRKVK